MRGLRPPRYTNLKPQWWKNQPRALSTESNELKKRINLVMQDFHAQGKNDGSRHKKLRQQSRIHSALGLSEGSLISAKPSTPRQEPKPRAQPKGAPAPKGSEPESDFNLIDFLDDKRSGQ